MSTEYCCEDFKEAVEGYDYDERPIIDFDDTIEFSKRVKYDRWYIGHHSYNQWSEEHEFSAIGPQLKYCPWCRRKLKHD